MAERELLLADVPAGGGVAEDKVVLSDIVEYTDPLYGLARFEVLEAIPVPGPGLVRLKVRYCREGV